MLVPLGYSVWANWEHIFVGDQTDDDCSLKGLCMALADVAIKHGALAGRERDASQLDAIATMMQPLVENWPKPKRLKTAYALIAKTIEAAIDQRNTAQAMLENPPKHDFWGAGEPDCPRDIKAGNGELHTLLCKKCGLSNPSAGICRADWEMKP